MMIYRSFDMKSFIEVLKKCESASGNGSKKVIQAALSELSDTGKKLVHYAMSPYLTFGVKKFTAPEKYADFDSDIRIVFDVLDALASREMTGDVARTAVKLMMGAFTKESASYIERILNKDLRAGFSASTFNKIHPDSSVPVFDLMLADKCSDEADFEKNVQFPVLGDVKYDGKRFVAIVTKNKHHSLPLGVTYFSRSGLEAFECNGLFDSELMQIQEFIQNNSDEDNSSGLYGLDDASDFILDGELFGNDFTDTMNAKADDAFEAKARLKIRAFFIMSVQDWLDKKTTITMRQNRENIRKITESLALKKIKNTDCKMLRKYSDIVQYANEVQTPGFDGTKNGHEGLILKNPNSTYTWDRSKDWIKVKKFYDADCVILSWEPGSKNTRNEHRMGAVDVQGYLEDGTLVQCKVGSGFSDEQRDDFVLNFEKNWKNKVIEVKYQEVTKSKSKDVHSLRFPTFVRIRDDKIVEFN